MYNAVHVFVCAYVRYVCTFAGLLFKIQIRRQIYTSSPQKRAPQFFEDCAFANRRIRSYYLYWEHTILQANTQCEIRFGKSEISMEACSAIMLLHDKGHAMHTNGISLHWLADNDESCHMRIHYMCNGACTFKVTWMHLDGGAVNPRFDNPIANVTCLMCTRRSSRNRVATRKVITDLAILCKM